MHHSRACLVFNVSRLYIYMNTKYKLGGLMMTVLPMSRVLAPRFLNAHLGLFAAVLISAASVYSPSAAAAPIYKVVDEATGQVTFTDQPQRYEQQADKQVSQIGVTTGNDTIGVDTPNDNRPISATSRPSSGQPASALNTSSLSASVNRSARSAPISYQVAITEPSEERAYQRPAQNITVSVQVKPALQDGAQVRIYLDNKEVAQGLQASIATIDVLPGAHDIKAVVTTEKGQPLSQAVRTIYVIQNTTVQQNKKKIAQQLLAYQNLPWYQKVLLKRRQKAPSSLSQNPNRTSMGTDAFVKTSR